jgi:hypothetical protein
MKINKSETLEAVLEKYPQTVAFLQGKGVVCFVCGEPTWGTLEEIISKKGFDVDSTIDELNKFLGL